MNAARKKENDKQPTRDIQDEDGLCGGVDRIHVRDRLAETGEEGKNQASLLCVCIGTFSVPGREESALPRIEIIVQIVGFEVILEARLKEMLQVGILSEDLEDGSADGLNWGSRANGVDEMLPLSVITRAEHGQ